MTTFAAVTTCNLDGWKNYGRRMAETFARYWPTDVPLMIYSEDVLPVARMPLPDWLVEFKRRHEGNPAAHGRANGRYDYTHDCVRFAHKVGAVTDAALSSDADVLIWLDADTVTHSPVTPLWLESLKPPESYIAWLDRERMYPECGFYMLSVKHPEHKEIMRLWVDLYVSDVVFALAETHDCFSLQQIIESMERCGYIKVHSLSGEKGRKTSHPFVNSQLAECLDHLKGPRKTEGRSRRSDLKGNRPEAYWQ